MKYFKPHEFACKCGKCGHGIDKMNKQLLSMLDDLREKAGIPLILNSAYRCPEHNDSLKESVPNSSHTKGMAVDIRCVDSVSRYKILKAAFEVGFRRIEPRSVWIHLDVDPDKPQDVVFYG